MQIVVSCMGVVLLHLLLFEMFGTVTAVILRMESSVSKNLVTGFFVYFSLFQIVGLPMVLLKQPLSALSNTWMVILILVAALFLYCLIRKRERVGISFPIKRNWNIYVWLMLICVLVLSYFVIRQNYFGWDTAYYIGNINASLYTDTMYQFDGSSGLPRKTIDFRYALSMFYMNGAVFCKWTGIGALEMQKYVTALLAVILNAVLLWLVGQELFHKDNQKTAFFTAAALGLNFFFLSEYTTSQFLLLRSYESKAFCGSVVMPAIFYGLLRVWNENENQKSVWKFIFIIMFASVPISMSSILTVPVLLVIGLLAEFIIGRKFEIIKYGILCAMPNAVYLIVYYLHTQGILIIKV